MTEAGSAHDIPPPGRRDWIALLSAILGAFMAILDIQIINSSLKDIQGALSATVEEGSWISTSYLVAEIIIIPLAAWLTMILSPRRFAVTISTIFVIASLLCSMAWNLESMIVFRALQGLARTQGAKAPPSALVVCPASAAGRFPRRRGPVLGQGGDWALVRVAVR